MGKSLGREATVATRTREEEQGQRRALEVVEMVFQTLLPQLNFDRESWTLSWHLAVRMALPVLIVCGIPAG